MPPATLRITEVISQSYGGSGFPRENFIPDTVLLYQTDVYKRQEYSDPMKREHSQWDTRVFDYGRQEVREFLISNALYWLEEYHMDGLRLNNVSSMLYLDYGKESWEWTPNIQGGRENLEDVYKRQGLCPAPSDR